MRKAVMTIEHNEKVFLPIWLKYYRQFFKDEDIYVLQHQSNVVVEAVHSEKIEEGMLFDHGFLVGKVKDFYGKLLERYDYVLFTEVDEIVWSPFGLGKFIDSFKENLAYCLGYEIIQNQEIQEPPIDWERPLLRQRKDWAKNVLYNKPLLSRNVINWIHGFHSIEGDSAQTSHEKANPYLFLLHLKRIDLEQARDRWYYTDHHKLTTDAFLNHFNQYNSLMEEMPEWVKDAI